MPGWGILLTSSGSALAVAALLGVLSINRSKPGRQFYEVGVPASAFFFIASMMLTLISGLVAIKAV